MPKMRLQIAGLEIVLRKIISVTIDEINFKKDDYCAKDSRVLVGFYNFVRRNKENISYICYKDHKESDYVICALIKNCKLHSEDFPAFVKKYDNFFLDFDSFYLDGQKLNFSEWRKKSRRLKLEKLKEK